VWIDRQRGGGAVDDFVAWLAVCSALGSDEEAVDFAASIAPDVFGFGHGSSFAASLLSGVISSGMSVLRAAQGGRRFLRQACWGGVSSGLAAPSK
jgi:hypothetical protein